MSMENSIIIKVTDNQGQQQTLHAQSGQTLMEALSNANVAGMVAACGGACACATCHIFVEPESQAIIGKASDLEEVLLDMADDKQDNSRLACQIELTNNLSALAVRVADND